MPLISSSTPSGVAATAIQVRNQEVSKEQGHCQYEDYHDLDAEFDMEDAIRNPGRPQKILRTPSIPRRSERRVSKLLDNVMLELQSLSGSTTEEDPRDDDSADPLELYLSSEEDASFSDFDDSDSLDFEPFPVDEGAEQSSPSSRRSSRRSQEDTARVVSFVMAGKAQIVDIYMHSNSASLQKQASTSQNSSTSLPQTRRPLPFREYPVDSRRESIISVSSAMALGSLHRSATTPMPYESTLSLNTFSSRKPSRLDSMVSSTKNVFLSSDPFAKNDDLSTSPSETSPTTPKTPISMAAAAWKTGLGRIARKQPSTKTSTSDLAGRNRSRSDLLQDSTSGVIGDADQGRQRQRAATTPQPIQEESGSPAEIVRGAGSPTKRATLQKEPKEWSHGLGMRAFTRRKSVKGKDRLLG